MRLWGERSGDRTLCITSSLFHNPLFAQTLSPSIKHMSWTKKWKLWCWTTLCQNVEMSEVWKWESQLWATGPVLKRPQNNTKISEWTKTTTMGSGLGLVSDKTHRVLSSLVGEVHRARFSQLLATCIKLSSYLVSVLWLLATCIKLSSYLVSVLCGCLTWCDALMARRGAPPGKPES